MDERGIEGDYHKRPNTETARGSVDMVLAEGIYSHALLYDEKNYSHGGYYFNVRPVTFEEDVNEVIKAHPTSGMWRGTGAFRGSTGYTSDKANFVMAIDLNEDADEQLAEFDELLKKVRKEHGKSPDVGRSAYF